jgi:signal peptidase II
MMNMKEVSWFRLWPYALLAALVVVLDQWSKLWVLDHIVYNWREPVIEGFFDLTHVYNPGAAFSFLAGASGWQKYLFAGLAAVVTLYLASGIRSGKFGRLGDVAAAMIIGGAIGNVIDRINYGHVIDFLLFYWNNHYYPAFNVADSFICVGAALFVIDGFRQGKRNQAT